MLIVHLIQANIIHPEKMKDANESVFGNALLSHKYKSSHENKKAFLKKSILS